METEQELNKKLAEWVGFKTDAYGWMRPDSEWTRFLPHFDDSLDACFKWLVPERISEITFMYASNCVSCDIEGLDSNFFEGHVDTKSIEEAWTKSALALCLAIKKLIGDKDD